MLRARSSNPVANRVLSGGPWYRRTSEEEMLERHRTLALVEVCNGLCSCLRDEEPHLVGQPTSPVGLAQIARVARGARTVSRLVGSLLVLALLLPMQVMAGTAEEAARQAAFAQQELDSGRYGRALKSAESALRLDPGGYGAIVLKALAYEGLGNLELAEALLLAYFELAGESPDVGEAGTIMKRVRLARRGRSAQRTTVRRVDTGAPVVRVPEAGPPADLDPGPYRDRVAEALRVGRCRGAVSAATELTLAEPNLAEGWRLAGDAARCHSDHRRAVSAYRRYETLGGADPAVLHMIGDLAANLAVLKVTLVVEGVAVPWVRAIVGDDEIGPESLSATELRFPDLPPGHAMTLLVGGLGFSHTRHEVEPLRIGGQQSVEIAPEHLGTGTVNVGQFDKATTDVRLVMGAQEVPVSPGESVRITAGAAVARVSNEFGTVETSVVVDRDEAIRLEPGQVVPASLTLVGLPAGSRLRVFVQSRGGGSLEQIHELDPVEGEVDPRTGVPVAAPFPVESLSGGNGGAFLGHPVLGEGALSLVLQGGVVNAATFDHTTLPGTADLAVRYEEWKSRVEAAQRRRWSWLIPPGLAAIAGGVGLGVFDRLRAGSAEEEAALWDEYQLQVAQGDYQGTGNPVSQAWNAFDRQRAATRRAQVGLGIAGGVLAVGGTITIVLAAKNGTSRQAAVWEPWSPSLWENTDDP